MNYNKNVYELLFEQNIDELKSVGYLFKHKKSGARIAIVSNDDENKVFSIGFRTPPSDSTGVPHILEHSVLCGSDKYPVKDPFIELAKGSLNTFLNAMTFPDKTIYPVASCNDADFKNLMDVYMDAVLHPLIGSRKEVFLQEGWHFEMENAEAPLTYNGVVYNEMKGAFSSPDDVLLRYCMNSLYPDTSYATESGGDPKNIPDLTYEAFVEFHKKLYHPANSYIYIYGNCDMTERLEYLDREYLSKYDAIQVDSELKVQTPFTQMQRVETEYSVTAEEGTEKKTYLAYNFSICDALDLETVFGFSILEYALLAAPGAPVKQALTDAGLGDEIYSSFDDGVRQPFLSIVAKNTDPDREEEFVKIIRDTLTDLVKNGLNKQTLEAGINSDEFKYREADFGRFPKGLMYGINMLTTWLYDENHPFDRIALNKAYQFLKDNLNTGFFEGLIEKYLLNNPHSSLVVLKPVVDLASKEEAKLAEKLAKIKANLSAEEIDAIVKQTADLKAYQAEPSTEEELKSIPLLTREDIRKESIPLYNDFSEMDGVPVAHHNIYTNGIGYLNLSFDIHCVPDEDIPYLGILSAAIGYVDTDAHSFEEFSNEVDIFTGGIAPDFTSYQNYKNLKEYRHMFQVKAKALTTRFDKVFALIQEMVYTSHYDDYKRLKEILAESRSIMQGKLISAGHGTAIAEASAQYDEAARIGTLATGIYFYDFLGDILDNFEEKKSTVAQKLANLVDLIFNKDNLIVSVTVAKEEAAPVMEELAKFLSALPQGGKPVVERAFTYERKKIAYKTAGQVNYVARVGNFCAAGLEHKPALTVLKTIMGYEYLWTNIRVLGGAYGCMSNFGKNGKSYFVSYRDPNCRKTNEVYEGVPAYVAGFDVSEREMTKYIIGTFSTIDTPMSPAAKGSRSFSSWMSNITYEELQEERDGLIATGVDDIRSCAPIMQAILDNGCMVVVGSNDAITKDADMFDEIRTLA